MSGQKPSAPSGRSRWVPRGPESSNIDSYMFYKRAASENHMPSVLGEAEGSWVGLIGVAM